MVAFKQGKRPVFIFFPVVICKFVHNILEKFYLDPVFGVEFISTGHT